MEQGALVFSHERVKWADPSLIEKPYSVICSRMRTWMAFST